MSVSDDSDASSSSEMEYNFQDENIKGDSDTFGKEIYNLCRSLGIDKVSYPQFQARYEAKIRKNYPVFDKHIAGGGKTLPLTYKTLDNYHDYWKPFFLLQALSTMRSEHFSVPENMVSIVKSVKDSGRNRIVVFQCTVCRELIQILYFSNAIVSLTEERLEDKNCFPHKRYGRTLNVKSIRKKLAKTQVAADPIAFQLFDYGNVAVLLPRNEYSEDIKVGDTFFMNIIVSYFTFSRHEKNFLRLRANQFFNDNFLNPKAHKLNLFLVEGSKFDQNLNPYQNLAVQSVMKYYKRKERQQIIQILGPPGSGKTHTIVAMLESAFNENSNARILVCTPSNAAVDIIARRVIEKGFMYDTIDEPGPIFRMGVIEKIDEQLKCFNPKSPAHYKRLLKPRTLVFSTLDSCQPYFMEHRSHNIEFDMVIIDEACQAVEPETLMAFAYKCSLYVLVGDHKQLQPTITSPLCASLGYGRSFFERLQNIKDMLNDTTTIGLWYQYRMRHEICSFPSKQFYRGSLKTVQNSGMNCNIALPPVTCFNVMGTVEERVNTSVQNFQEANFIFKMLVNILAKHVNGAVPVSIGIICFYRGQAQYIYDGTHALYSSYPQLDIQVDTVDAFQGREKDIIIISCSRANQSKAIGFSESPNRLNVALTRAKSASILVLDQSTFQHEPLWQELFYQYSEINRLFSVKASTEIFDKYFTCYPGSEYANIPELRNDKQSLILGNSNGC